MQAQRKEPPIIAFAIVASLLLLDGNDFLSDPDTLWHVAVGKWIVQHGTVPWTDPFSHTFAGQDWIAKEWLSQLLMYAVDSIAGLHGLVIASVVLVAATFAAQYRYLTYRLRAWAAAMVVAVAMFCAMGHFLARPHLLVFPLLLYWVVAMVKAVETSRSPPWHLAPLMMLWANLHGSFPLGLAIAGLLALEAIAGGPRGARLRGAVRWSMFGATLIVASCLTPYGYYSALVGFTLTESGEAFRFTEEWGHVGFDMWGALFVSGVVMAFAVLVPRWRAEFARLLVLLLLVYMMATHVRFMSLFAIAAPILCARAAASRYPIATRSSDRALPFGAVVAILWVPAAIAAFKIPVPSPGIMPVSAVRAARDAGVAATPVFNDHDFGGYLISVGIPTFVDGRTDQLFLGGFLTRVRDAAAAAEPDQLEALLDDYSVGWALVRSGGGEVKHLAKLPGWVEIHEDPVATVYVRRHSP